MVAVISAPMSRLRRRNQRIPRGGILPQMNAAVGSHPLGWAALGLRPPWPLAPALRLEDLGVRPAAGPVAITGAGQGSAWIMENRIGCTIFLPSSHRFPPLALNVTPTKISDSGFF